MGMLCVLIFGASTDEELLQDLSLANLEDLLLGAADFMDSYLRN